MTILRPSQSLPAVCRCFAGSRPHPAAGRSGPRAWARSGAPSRATGSGRCIGRCFFQGLSYVLNKTVAMQLVHAQNAVLSAFLRVAMLVGSWARGVGPRVRTAQEAERSGHVSARHAIFFFFFFFCEAEGLALRQRNPTSLSARRGSGCRILSQAFACRTKSRKSELRGCC